MPLAGGGGGRAGGGPQIRHHREPRPQRQMSDSAGRQDDPPAEQPAHSDTLVRVLEICNKKGLHARASAKFVQTVEQFDAEVWVTKGHETVGGTSIMGLMMLAAGTGSSITVEAVGPQAAEVIEALSELVNSRFA